MLILMLELVAFFCFLLAYYQYSLIYLGVLIGTIVFSYLYYKRQHPMLTSPDLTIGIILMGPSQKLDKFQNFLAIIFSILALLTADFFYFQNQFLMFAPFALVVFILFVVIGAHFMLPLYYLFVAKPVLCELCTRRLFDYSARCMGTLGESIQIMKVDLSHINVMLDNSWKSDSAGKFAMKTTDVALQINGTETIHVAFPTSTQSFFEALKK